MTSHDSPWHISRGFAARQGPRALCKVKNFPKTVTKKLFSNLDKQVFKMLEPHFFFLMNLCDSSAGLAKARPRLVCSHCRVHPYIFKIKSFQTVWISGVFSVRSTRKFFKTKPSNSLIFCAFNVSYNRTFFKIKASNSLNFSCFQCTLNPHFSKNQGLTQVEF